MRTGCTEMPQLPPRNLPLSPPGKPVRQGSPAAPAPGIDDGSPARATPSRKASKAGSNTPTPSRPSGSSRNASRLASASLSPGPSSPLRGASPARTSESGTLERQDETTFHRKMRALLIDHCSACAVWEEIVSMQGAKSIAVAAGAAASLDELLARGKAREVVPDTSQEQREHREGKRDLDKDDALPPILAASPEEQKAKRLDDMAKAMQVLNAESAALDAMLSSRLAKVTAKLEALSDAGEALLLNATNARGDVFTFSSPFWTTWSMDRFVSTVQVVTDQYLLQTAQLKGLVDVLFREGCISSSASCEAKDEARRIEEIDVTKNGKDDLDEDEKDDDEPLEATATLSSKDKKATKRRALIRQRVLELWQALPLLHNEKTGIDAAWFEELCSVEVGRWHEE